MKNNLRLQLKYLDKANGTMLWHLPEKPTIPKAPCEEETLASLLSSSQDKTDIKKIQQALKLLKEIMDDSESDERFT